MFGYQRRNSGEGFPFSFRTLLIVFTIGACLTVALTLGFVLRLHDDSPSRPQNVPIPTPTPIPLPVPTPSPSPSPSPTPGPAPSPSPIVPTPSPSPSPSPTPISPVVASSYFTQVEPKLSGGPNRFINYCVYAGDLRPGEASLRVSFDQDEPTVINSEASESDMPWTLRIEDTGIGCGDASVNPYYYYDFVDFDRDKLDNQRLEVKVIACGFPYIGETDYPVIFLVDYFITTQENPIKTVIATETFSKSEEPTINYISGSVIIPKDRVKRLQRIAFEMAFIFPDAETSVVGKSLQTLPDKSTKEYESGVQIILQSSY